jgi:hypothetical protein
MNRRLSYLLVLALTGCGLTPPYLRTIPPQSTTLVSSQAPDATYACAMAVFNHQPTMVQLMNDPQARVMSGQWHHAAQMVVTVQAHPPGSLVTVQGSVPPNKITVGEFDEVPALAALIKARCV